MLSRVMFVAIFCILVNHNSLGFPSVSADCLSTEDKKTRAHGEKNSVTGFLAGASREPEWDMSGQN